MNKKKKDTRWLTSVALMAAIVILLMSTPLGLIQLPTVKATTGHIPVILGAVLLGPMAGAILGGVFGICSLIHNTIYPTSILSFVFSPFLSTTGMAGAIKSVWISVGCRIVIGIAAGWLWIFLKRFRLRPSLALLITGFIGSMTNTVMVMGSIYLLFYDQYAKAMKAAMDAVLGLIIVTVTASGIPEAIVAAVLVSMIGNVLMKIIKP